MSTRVFSYWSGPVTWMERLSVASILRTGHDLTVYSYEPIRLDCRVLDAREIMPTAELDDLRTQMPDYFSDLLRVEGMAQGRGTWLDLDMIMLKHLPDDHHLFGWEKAGRLCNAVLRLPIRSPILDDYVSLCRSTWKDPTSRPWEPWHKQLSHHRRMFLRRLRGKPPTAPKCGPKALTYLVNKHRLAPLAQPSLVFYPIEPAADHVALINKPNAIENLIQPDTVGIHLWRSLYRVIHGSAAPTTGWLAKQINATQLSSLSHRAAP